MKIMLSCYKTLTPLPLTKNTSRRGGKQEDREREGLKGKGGAGKRGGGDEGLGGKETEGKKVPEQGTKGSRRN